ncbi:5'/3'-nucleotidase SurE [Streptomyces sp. A7024]|uniref:5'-nucleotidase SurE n=1 Tax=Streptomyces coryli TaxID=1128680 RepID=A0A6G4U990_9ACTN|nr:5'/3'-nucleotidase SurE [Streptomyces coryli]NGN67877.1 5'/3'-nucleotidase SurE [Streptomyces coryli]
MLRTPARIGIATIAAATTGALLAGSAPAASGSKAAADPLKILISNDDGYKHPYIRQLQAALKKSGHDAVIVAPADDQSGKGTGLSFSGSLKAAEEEPGIWSVSGTPGDAVTFGIRQVFKDAKPDLIVSGVNAGPNAGPTANHSGTVGATVAANDQGIPAVAVSADFDLTNPQNPFPTVPQAADFTARTVDRLAKTARSGPLLPSRTALNINYPAKPASAVAFTNIGRAAHITVKYVPDPAACPTCFKITPGLDPNAPEPVGNADTSALRAGKVSVSLLNGDWGVQGWASGQGGPTEREVRMTRARLQGLEP